VPRTLTAPPTDRADRLADLDQLLLDRFGADVVSRGLALRAKSLADPATEPKKGAA
jgi:hypothetical protein